VGTGVQRLTEAHCLERCEQGLILAASSRFPSTRIIRRHFSAFAREVPLFGMERSLGTSRTRVGVGSSICRNTLISVLRTGRKRDTRNASSSVTKPIGVCHRRGRLTISTRCNPSPSAHDALDDRASCVDPAARRQCLCSVAGVRARDAIIDAHDTLSDAQHFDTPLARVRVQIALPPSRLRPGG
jgi:hypothetical protein